MKKVLCVAVALVMALCIVACGGDKIVWTDIVMGNKLPEPSMNKGEILTNSTDELWLKISDVSDKQFNDYIDKCKEKGFNIDAESDSYSFSAFNAEGYELNLSHYSKDSDMTIQLSSPMEMSNISWPAVGPGSLLPSPKSATGLLRNDSSDSFSIYIGNTSKADYAEYVNACSQAGFNVDYGKDDTWYRAYNSEGWFAEISYNGGNIMSVYVEAPEEETSEEVTTESVAETTTEASAESTDEATTEAATEATTSAKSGSELRSDFKEAMDSYEEFIDEYVAFMKKYKANPTDLALLADYTTYLSRYSEFVKDFEKWDSANMNDAELAYYIDVQTRVNKKVLEVS